MTKEVLKNYYKAINSMVEELLKKEGYDAICWQKHEGEHLKDCDISEGTEFIASDGSDDGEVMIGFWVGSDIGGLLCVNEDQFLSADIIKEALQFGASLGDVFEYLNYETDCHEQQVTQQFNFRSYFKLG